MKKDSKKIILTGMGRAGTTFLVQLFTRLGFHTGFKAYGEPFNAKLKAGCEFDIGDFSTAKLARITFKKLPTVIKNNDLSFTLKELIIYKIIEIEHVFIPIRDLDDATDSRIDAGLWWRDAKTRDEQRNIIAMANGYAVANCVALNVPYTILKFPDFVTDHNYCFERIYRSGILMGRSSNAFEFKKIFKELSNPSMIKRKK